MTDIQNSMIIYKIGQILEKKFIIFVRGLVTANSLDSCVGRITNFEAKAQTYFNVFFIFT